MAPPPLLPELLLPLPSLATAVTVTVLSAARPPESVTSRRNTQVPAAGRVTLATALSADWMLTGVPETSVQLQPTMLLPPTPVLALPSSVTVLPALT